MDYHSHQASRLRSVINSLDLELMLDFVVVNASYDVSTTTLSSYDKLYAFSWREIFGSPAEMTLFIEALRENSDWSSVDDPHTVCVFFVCSYGVWLGTYQDPATGERRIDMNSRYDSSTCGIARRSSTSSRRVY